MASPAGVVKLSSPPNRRQRGNGRDDLARLRTNRASRTSRWISAGRASVRSSWTHVSMKTSFW